MSTRRFGKAAAVAVLAITPVLSAVPGATAHTAGKNGSPDWTTYGYSATDTRDQPFEHDITPATVGQLAPKWIATTSGDVSATPAVVGGAAYFGDFGGSIWKLDASTGAVIWQDSVPALTGLSGDYARSSPSVDGNVVIFGTNKTPLLIGLDTATGALLWTTQVNPDLHGTITGSPQLSGNTVFVGVSAAGASGPTATFRSDIASVNALTGALNWEAFSLPDNGGQPGGYAGATVFSSPAIDAADHVVFGTFGQPYVEPPSVAACNLAAPNGFFSESCEQPGAYWDSIVAFNITTGAPVWSYRIVGDKPWQKVCGPDPVSWCLPETDTPIAPASIAGRGFGDAWDIGGSSPNVFTVGGKRVVGFGAKSGVYYLFDARTGKLQWNTLVGPGGDQGGFEWGSATDGKRIYVSLTNMHHIPYQLTQHGITGGPAVTGGSWAALDPKTGKIIWQVADPQTEDLGDPTGVVGVWDLGPATVSNGVDYVTSMAKTGSEMYALSAATGAILWQYSAGSGVNAGPAIVDGSVYWGSGYARAPEGSGNNKLFAFSVGGVVDTTGPTTTISLHGSSPVTVSVKATDNPGGVGVYATRCVLDPRSTPAGFASLPPGPCTLSRVTSPGRHTVYAAAEDRDNNVGAVVSVTFTIAAKPHKH